MHRERRKLRFQELEEALNGLSEQMQAKQYEVAGLQNQNAVLQVCQDGSMSHVSKVHGRLLRQLGSYQHSR